MWRCWGEPGRGRKPPPEADCPVRQRRMPQPGRRPGVSTWRDPRSRLPGTKARRTPETGRTNPSILRLSIHFAHHLNRLVEIRLAIMAHDVEHLGEDRIRQGIENLIGVLPIYHNLPAAQDGEVLGEVRLLDPELGLHGSQRKASLPHHFQRGGLSAWR